MEAKSEEEWFTQGHYACGTCPLCLHKDVPCGFGTFFCVTVVTHVTAHDVLVTR